jgi:hypothetical protein
VRVHLPSASEVAIYLRRARLRCDRERPACRNCLARREPGECQYEAVKNQASFRIQLQPQNGAMLLRINRLEALVTKLTAANTDISAAASDGDVVKATSNGCSSSPENSRPPGITSVANGHSVYEVADDWYDVLQEVSPNQ